MPLDTTYTRIFLVGSFVCTQGASLSMDLVQVVQLCLMPWLTTMLEHESSRPCTCSGSSDCQSSRWSHTACQCQAGSDCVLPNKRKRRRRPWGVNQNSRRVSKWKVLPRARHIVLLSVADQRCLEQNHSIRITVDVEEHLTILAMAGAGLQLIWAERVNVLVHNIYWLSGARPRVRLERP